MYFHRNRFTCSCKGRGWGGGGGGEGLNDLKFGTFIGRFPSDGATSMAVKGLILSPESFTTVAVNHFTFSSAVIIEHQHCSGGETPIFFSFFFSFSLQSGGGGVGGGREL